MQAGLKDWDTGGIQGILGCGDAVRGCSNLHWKKEERRGEGEEGGEEGVGKRRGRRNGVRIRASPLSFELQH